MNQTYSLQEGYRRRAEGNIPYSYVTVVRDGVMAYVDSNHLLLKIHGDVQCELPELFKPNHLCE